MRRHPSCLPFALVLCAACTVAPADPPAEEMVEDALPVTAASCPLGTVEEVCSGTGTVWTALHRVSRSPESLVERAQTFRVSTSGFPATLRLKLRLPSTVTASPAPDLVVAIRPVSGGVVPTASTSDVARARLSTTLLPRGRAAEFVLNFASTTPATPVALVPGQEYAFVASVDHEGTGAAVVGIASHQTNTYANGSVYARRTGPSPSFDPIGDGTDLSFALTLDNPTCTDGLKNGSETAVDCGGPICGACVDGLACVLPRDCQSSVCTGNVCKVPTCSDSAFNQDESDVDCGGAVCPKCVTGDSCRGNGDCVAGVCTGNLCQAPSCTDSVKNGNETGTDCGGSCPRCAIGVACTTGADCATRYCSAGVCAYPTTCAQIDVSDATANDGTYSVYPSPPTAEPTYCLMSQVSGGWTLVQRTVWDWTLSSALITNYANFYGTRVGNPATGSAFRMPGRWWPTVSPGKEHLLVVRVRRTNGTVCAPLYYRTTNGTWSISSGGPATITGYTASPHGSNIFNGQTIFSTTSNGPSPSCVSSSNGAPWPYGSCCSTCPTFGGSYFNPSRPMISWLTTTDVLGTAVGTACAGGTAVTSDGYYGLESLDYYVK